MGERPEARDALKYRVSWLDTTRDPIEVTSDRPPYRDGSNWMFPLTSNAGVDLTRWLPVSEVGEITVVPAAPRWSPEDH